MFLSISLSAGGLDNKYHTDFVKAYNSAIIKSGANKKENQRKACKAVTDKYKPVYIEVAITKRPKMRSSSYWKKAIKEIKKALALKD